MAKLTKDLFGVVSGDVYPKTIPAGEECPPELEEAALAEGALEIAEAGQTTPAVSKAAPETKVGTPPENKGQ